MAGSHPRDAGDPWFPFYSQDFGPLNPPSDDLHIVRICLAYASAVATSLICWLAIPLRFFNSLLFPKRLLPVCFSSMYGWLC